MGVFCMIMTVSLIGCIGCVLRCASELDRCLDEMISMRQQVEYLDGWTLVEEEGTGMVLGTLRING